MNIGGIENININGCHNININASVAHLHNAHENIAVCTKEFELPIVDSCIRHLLENQQEPPVGSDVLGRHLKRVKVSQPIPGLCQHRMQLCVVSSTHPWFDRDCVDVVQLHE